MKKKVVWILVIAICIIVLLKNFMSNESEYLIIANANQNELYSEGKLTSIGVIKEFFSSLNNGDAKTLNELYVQNYFGITEQDIGYFEFPKQEIYDVKVKILDKSTKYDEFYEVKFKIKNNTAPPLMGLGSGKTKCYFNILMENTEWKIKDISTSP